MSKLFQKIALCVLASSLSATAVAADAPVTRELVVERVEKAAAFFKENGKEKSLVEFNDPKSQFNQGGMYMFGMLFDDGITQPIHSNPKIRGKKMGELKDADGKPLIQNLNKVCETKGAGWVEYKWINKETSAIDLKSSYVMKMGDMCIGTGMFAKK